MEQKEDRNNKVATKLDLTKAAFSVLSIITLMAAYKVTGDPTFEPGAYGGLGGIMGAILFTSQQRLDVDRLALRPGQGSTPTYGELMFWVTKVMLGAWTGFVVLSLLPNASTMTVPAKASIGIISGFSGQILNILARLLELKLGKWLTK